MSVLKYTEAERKVAINFAQDLVNCGIHDYIGSRYDESSRDEWWDSYRRLPYVTEDYAGATRAVFCRDDGMLDRWVLKVDFQNNSQHYCRHEVEFYEEAIRAGVDYAFAATYFLCEIEGIKFYIQEKLDCGYNYDSSSSEKIREYIKTELGVAREKDEDEEDYEERISDWEDCYIEWDDVLACLIHDGAVEEFVYSRGINDLHKGNYGLTKEGYYKIIDFCGYYE